MLTLAPLTLHSWTWKVSMTDTVYVLRDARQLLDEVFRYPESRKSVVIRDALLAVSDNLPKTGKNKS